MRSRTGYLWALAVFALAISLAFVSHPGSTVNTSAGMSLPSTPAALIELAPAIQLVQLQFDWHGPTLGSANHSLTPVTGRAPETARQNEHAHPAQYGPLYRRPPPHFS
ncbi:MAG TPA: hypothetical protein VHY56_07845 [Candidatus Binataceae bacterium]|nr:hypothetical protein [Candidatus Binataceae bacterium]